MLTLKYTYISPKFTVLLLDCCSGFFCSENSSRFFH